MKSVFQAYQTPISTCKLCFRRFRGISPHIVGNNEFICPKCLSKFNPIFKKFDIDGIDGLTLFSYDVFMKDLIYRFKGCFDYELREIFLGLYKNELSILFKGYTVIPAPSFIGDDTVRGFNHVREIFGFLGLESIDAFEKTKQHKQSDQRMRDRKKIGEFIKFKDEIDLKNKILLVDDIYTTGATMKTLISMLKSRGIRDIKVLVICKTIDIDKRNNNLMQ